MCATMLVVAQILGLHYHRHVEQHGDDAHRSELHFEDAGLHPNESRPDHRHADAQAGGSSHRHIDVEAKALKAGVAKAFVDSLLLPLLLMVALLVPSTRGAACPRLHGRDGLRKADPARLRPPSQGPPAALVPA